MDESLLDTDILSEILKGQNQAVLATAQQYLGEHQRLSFSAITLYEIIRGLRAKGSVQRLGQFLQTASNSDVLPVSVPVLMRAADLWSEARQGGHPCDDADLIIAATALEAHRVLVTGNTRHFEWIPGLTLLDWRQP